MIKKHAGRHCATGLKERSKGMDILRKSTSRYVSEIISLLFLLCAAIYFCAVEELNKYTGLGDTHVYLFHYPTEYMMCITFGILAKITGLIIFLNAIGSSVCLIYSYIQRYGKEYEIKCISDCVVNWLLVSVTVIIQDKIIVPLGVILLSLAVIISGLWLYIATVIRAKR